MHTVPLQRLSAGPHMLAAVIDHGHALTCFWQELRQLA